MNYTSAYLWEQGKTGEISRVSVVLQQVEVKNKQVVLACVCEGSTQGECGVTESGYFTEGLVEWFHRDFLKLCENKRRVEEVEKLLQKEVERLKAEVQKYIQKKGQKSYVNYFGMIFWENQFWTFTQGSCEAYLLNKRFNRKNMRRIQIQCSQQSNYWTGQIQRKVGVLLCASNYLQGVSQETALEVLNPEGELKEERMQKRLEELWREKVLQGKWGPTGAIWIHT